ncbi:MAG: hypothetical protein NTX17_05415 [Candidatus Eisenbacteria bacterium]|nr:hypothetical protein [Candidatus Eisenbacteria bacterium]
MPNAFKSQSRLCLVILTTAVVLALVTYGAVRADVTVQRLAKSNGFGGFGASETVEKLMISGDKECTKGITKYSGKLSSLMNRGAKEATSITRLDKELIWTIDHEKKTYTELTFAQMRQMMQSSAERLSRMNADSLRRAVQQFDSTVDVKRTGEKRTVAGLECERVIVTMRGVSVDGAGNVADTTWVKNDAWMAPINKVPAELRGFDAKMAEKMGLTEGGAMAGLLSQYADAFKKVKEKLEDLNGYPVASTLSITTTTHAQEKASAQEGVSAQAEMTESGEEAEAGKVKSITEARDVKSALGSLFKKKAKDEVKKKQEEKEKQKLEMAQAQTGPKTVLEVITETQSIETSGIDPSVFEIPAGYKKVEMPGMEK